MASSGDPFVTLTMAKAHLRVTSLVEDDIIDLYLTTAHHVVIDRLERATTDTVLLATIEAWDEDTAPGAIKAAVLVQLGELYRFRGDDVVFVKADPGRLSDRVEGLIGPWLERPLA